MKTRIMGIALGLLLASTAQAKTPAPAPHTALADTAFVLRAVRTLADPRWEGRGVGTAGIDSAASWIANEMRLAGLTPAGESGWYQPFEVTTGVEVQRPCFIEVAGHRDEVGEALQPLGFSLNGTAHAPVIFAGYGITAPGLQWDDYAGLDVHDHIVLVLSNEPGELDSTSRFDGTVNTPYAELRTKAINAREHGALGLLVVNGPTYHAGEPLRAPASDGVGYMTSGLLGAWVSEDVANRMLAGSGTTLAAAQEAIESTSAPRSFALADSITLTLALKRTRAKTSNVVGLLAGTDTTSTLVIGAHYDHLGCGGGSSLDPESTPPHVGADDNASGVAALLQAARDLGARAGRGWRPPRTIVFCGVQRRGDRPGGLVALHRRSAAAAREHRRHDQHGHGGPAARQQAHR